MVYSENDPFANVAYSEKFGQELGLELINVGNYGHINSDSHLGDWEQRITFLKRYCIDFRLPV